MKLLSLAIPGIFLLVHSRGMADPLPGEKTATAALPVPTTIERYASMIEHPPFAVATQAATPPPAVEVPGFAKDLVLTGAVRLNGSEYITFASRDQSQRFGLKTGDKTPDGIFVVSVAWSDVIGKTKVTLKRGNEFGVIAFDEAVGRPTAPGEGGVPANIQAVMPTNAAVTTVAPGNNSAPNPPTAVPIRRRLIRNTPSQP